MFGGLIAMAYILSLPPGFDLSKVNPELRKIPPGGRVYATAVLGETLLVFCDVKTGKGTHAIIFSSPPPVGTVVEFGDLGRVNATTGLAPYVPMVLTSDDTAWLAGLISRASVVGKPPSPPVPRTMTECHFDHEISPGALVDSLHHTESEHFCWLLFHEPGEVWDFVKRKF